MINAIIKGIFALIMMLFNLLFTPLISVITSLFPNLGNLFTYLSNYIVIGLTYVRSILALLMINDNMIITLFDYFVIMYTIYITTLVVRFSINVYNKFKL